MDHIGSRPINVTGANTVELEVAQGPPSHIVPISKQPSKAMAIGPRRTQSVRTAKASTCLLLMTVD